MVSTIHTPRKCIICPTVFIPRNGKQITCGNPECQKAMRNKYKYTKRNGEIKARIRYGKNKYISDEVWNAFSPCERWELMTLGEADAACKKHKITYGEAGKMAQNGTLPEDFGRRD